MVKHKPFCFALEPSACEGYFGGSEPPCICGASGDIFSALSEVAMPVVPAMTGEAMRSEAMLKMA
jgi:hypothetical protein